MKQKAQKNFQTTRFFLSEQLLNNSQMWTIDDQSTQISDFKQNCNPNSEYEHASLEFWAHSTISTDRTQRNWISSRQNKKLFQNQMIQQKSLGFNSLFKHIFHKNTHVLKQDPYSHAMKEALNAKFDFGKSTEINISEFLRQIDLENQSIQISNSSPMAMIPCGKLKVSITSNQFQSNQWRRRIGWGSITPKQ